MNGRRVAVADLRSSPWRNGAGVTFEVSSIPGGAADFDWRLSIARIERDAPFSTFPGVDRHLVLAADDPLTLAVTAPAAGPTAGPEGEGEGRNQYRLEHGQVIAFAGEAEVTGHVGPRGATVVNVMSRRAVYRSDVEVVRGDAGVLQGVPDLAAAVDLTTLDTLLVPGGHDTEPLREVFPRAGTIVLITRRPLSHPGDAE